MTEIDHDVHDGVLELLAELSGDWEYDGEIGLDTRFIADLGVESLEIVVLGSLLQQRYGTLPFARFLEEIGDRPVADRALSVRELVVFVCEHRAPAPAPAEV